MSPELFLRAIIRPGLAFMADVLAEPRMSSPRAEAILLAIAGQESALRHRKQQPGPARGFWQFERGGGFEGVLNHARTGPLAKKLIDELALPSDRDSLWQALPESELLQTSFARLLLWSDNAPLPSVSDKGAAWDTYIRNWRPGKPHRSRWDAHYDAAVAAVGLPDEPAAKPMGKVEVLDQMVALIQAIRAELLARKEGGVA